MNRRKQSNSRMNTFNLKFFSENSNFGGNGLKVELFYENGR